MKRQILRQHGAMLLIAGLLGFIGPLPGMAAPRSTAVAEVALTHGLLALEEGDVARAVELFELALRFDPDAAAAQLWLAVARERLAHPGEGGTAVLAPAGLLSATPMPPKWEGRLGVEAGRDSNPSLLPDEVTGGLPLTAGPVAAVPDEGGSLGLRLTRNSFFDRRGWSLGWTFSGHQSLHRDLNDLDLTFFEGRVSLAWGTDSSGRAEGPFGAVHVPMRSGRVAAVLQAGGSSVRLGGDPYLRTASGGGSLLIRGRAAGVTRLDLAVRNRRYDGDGPPPFQRSGTEVSLGASQSFSLRGHRSLRIGATAGRWDAGAAFDGSYTEGLAGVAAPLPQGWDFELLCSLREDRYAHAASSLAQPFAAARRDTTWRVLADVSRPLSDRVRLSVRGQWTDRASNVDFPPGFPLFDYRRTVLATGLTWAF